MNNKQKRVMELLEKDNTNINQHCLRTSCNFCKYINQTHAIDANYDCPLLEFKKEEQKKEYEEMRKELEKMKYSRA